jgi:hypothetical protein
VHTDPRPPFAQASRQLEASALVARISRAAVNHYKMLAWAAFWISAAAFDRDPDPDDGGGSIDARSAALVRGAAADLATVSWSPWVGRIRTVRPEGDAAASQGS